MSSVQDIEQAISRLKPEDLAKFCVWFTEFDAGVWDLQTEEDARAGRLDGLANEALAELREGRLRSCETLRDPKVLQVLPPTPG